MTRRRTVVRERLVGTGRLLSRSGTFLCSVSYDLRFYQEMLRADTLRGTVEKEGLGSGRGTLTVDREQGALRNTVEAVLELEGGQQIDVLFPQLSFPLSRVLRFITSGELRSPDSSLAPTGQRRESEDG